MAQNSQLERAWGPTLKQAGVRIPGISLKRNGVLLYVDHRGAMQVEMDDAPGEWWQGEWWPGSRTWLRSPYEKTRPHLKPVIITTKEMRSKYVLEVSGGVGANATFTLELK